MISKLEDLQVGDIMMCWGLRHNEKGLWIILNKTKIIKLDDSNRTSCSYKYFLLSLDCRSIDIATFLEDEVLTKLEREFYE